MVLIGSKTMTAASAMMNSGWTATIIPWGMIGRRAKTMITLRTQSASGITQSNTTAGTSIGLGSGAAIRKPGGTAASVGPHVLSRQVGEISAAALKVMVPRVPRRHSA